MQVQAVKTIQDLLTINYSNAAVLHSIHCDDVFLQLLLRQTIDKAPGERVSTGLVQHLIQLLQYMTFLLSQHNMQPLGNLVAALAKVQVCALPMALTVESAMLNTISTTLCDLRARRAPIDCTQLIPAVIDMIRYSVPCCTKSPVAMAIDCIPSDSRFLLLLEIFAILVHGSTTSIALAAHANGFTLMSNILCYNAQSEQGNESVDGTSPSCESIRKDTRMAVRHMALWILKDFVAHCSEEMNFTGWLVALLGVELPFNLKHFVFRSIQAVATTFTAKQYFRTSGALDILANEHILQETNRVLLECALMTLYILVRDCEENKVYITENVLQGNYSLLFNRIQTSGLPLTSLQFSVFLEFACIGPAYDLLAPETPDKRFSPEMFNDAGNGDGQSFAETACQDEVRYRAATVVPRDAASQLASDAFFIDASWGRVQNLKGSDISGQWRIAIGKHLQRIEAPQLLFLHGPPALTRNYAFLIELQRRREWRSYNDNYGSLSPRGKSEYLKDGDGSDSASETSSIRESVDLVARDLALQALLHESRTTNAKVAADQDDARQPKWWELVRRRHRASASAALTIGHKDADRGTPDLAPLTMSGPIGQQIVTSMLKLELGNAYGMPCWRPGSGWAMNSMESGPGIYRHARKVTPKVVIRGPKALNLLLSCVLFAVDEQAQGKMVNCLLRFAASSLAARRSLCHAGGLHRFLELSLDSKIASSPLVQRLIHVLATVVGRYDITLPEVKDLFLMAYATRSAKQKSRLLQVIAAISQRWEPVALAQLAGPSPAVSMALLEKFPSPKNGYTLCTWLKFGATPEAGESLIFCWKDAQCLILELFFRVWPREYRDGSSQEPICRRNLCARMRNSPCTHTEYFTFDELTFDTSDAWYHLVFTHNKQLITLYVDGCFVQSFQPLNYPIGVSKACPLRGIIGCSQESASATCAAFSDRCTGTFCGEVGLLHVTDGVWDAASAEIAAKSFPYGRTLQAMGITHRQMLLFDPLSYSPVPATNDSRDSGGSTPPIHINENTPAPGDDRHQTPSVQEIDNKAPSAPVPMCSNKESWREKQRDKARNKDKALNRMPDSRPVLFTQDSTLDPFTSRNLDRLAVARRCEAVAPAVDRTPFNSVSIRAKPDHAKICRTSAHRKGLDSLLAQTALATVADAISCLIPDSSGAATAYDSKLEEDTAGVRRGHGLPGIQGDLDVHHMGSIHNVAFEIGDFYLPLPFLRMPSPQRALGLRILLEMLYARDASVKAFREARAGNMVLHLLKGWNASGMNDEDPAYEALLEMLREQALPAEETMRLVVDLLLIDNLPLDQNITHLHALLDVLTAPGCDQRQPEHLCKDGALAVHRWKERCSGMPTMIEMLCRSSGEITRLLLQIVKLMWEPAFTTEDLEMMLEFCVTTVEVKLVSVLDSCTDEEENRRIAEKETVGTTHFRDDVQLGKTVDVPCRVNTATRELTNGINGKHILDHSNRLDYVYGYNSQDELNLESAEIDSKLAHGLGIANCDFHDMTGSQEHALDNCFIGKVDSLTRTEVDYVAQISKAKVEALIFIREVLVSKVPNTAVELLRGAGGFHVIFALLNSPNERSRLVALDLLGLLLCHGKPADAKAFAVAGGFDTVGKYLVRQWISHPVGWALLCLAIRTPNTAVDTYEWLEGRCSLAGTILNTDIASSSTSNTSEYVGPDEDGVPVVVNFEALYCLLQLLQFGTIDESVARDMAERVSQIVTSSPNLDQLMANNFADWFFAFMAKVRRHVATRRSMRQRSHVTQAVRRVYSEWLLSHIPRTVTAKTVKQLRKAIVDAAEFGIHLLEDVLAFFKENPVVAQNDVDNVIKNLASIFEHIEEITNIPVETCVSIVALINNLAVRNNSTARNFMMTYKLLDTRGETAVASLGTFL